ncbi:MAG: GGDEF domain-containing protein, partial [Campylobacterota bacterium]|nr:GGDEF domain-containing protein [Campylobacterota bacterium]
GKEKEEENELVSLKREMNWMADLIKRRDKELKKALEKAQETSITDPLTGLFNRRYFSYRLEEELSRFNRTHQVLCLFLIDIDNFKQINDQCGHQQGDMVLSEIGKEEY